MNSLSYLTYILILLILGNSNWSSSKENQTDSAMAAMKETTNFDISKANNEFAFRLFEEINRGGNENLFFSPMSIFEALLMAMNGSEGETLEEFKKTLGLDQLSQDLINVKFKEFSQTLHQADSSIIFNSANSLWVKEGLSLNPSFKQSTEQYYRATISSLDMGSPQAPNIINQWIEKSTEGLIRNMINQIPPETVMYLVNAIYFKGEWKFPFDDRETRKAAFYPESGNKVSVDMMETIDISNYRIDQQGDNLYLEIPYGNGQIHMGIIMNTNGKLSQSLPGLTHDELMKISKRASDTEAVLRMPKFKMQMKTDQLVDILSNMGIEKAFENQQANFNKVFDNPTKDLAISKIIHEALIDVDEKGTEAAAATTIEMGVTSLPPPPLIITLDKPFLFFIQERESGAILFIGKYADPSRLN